MAKLKQLIKTKAPVGKKIAWSTPMVKPVPKKIKVKQKPVKTLHSRYV